LAGRCGILVLLPPDLCELGRFPDPPDELFQLLWQGAYPRIYDRQIPAHQWLTDYTTTYIQRDARQVINIGDLQTFTGFLKMCAGRTAQEINLSKLGSDAGVSHNTARAWLSVLETSYIIHRLPAWHVNIRKQLIKAPKLHFFDSGLVCYLLGIREPEQLRLHPLRGAIFESWVVSELYKVQVHEGFQPRLFHYREARGPEVDLIIEQGQNLLAVEIKSGATVTGDFFKNLTRFSQRMGLTGRPFTVQSQVVFGGEKSQHRSKGHVLSWQDTHRILEK
jgi:predicted AAA+ superfamily ATPase